MRPNSQMIDLIAGLRSPVSSAPFISEEQRQGELHDQN